MALDDKCRMMRGRIEFFERNIHKLSKHLTTMVAQHKGDNMSIDMTVAGLELLFVRASTPQAMSVSILIVPPEGLRASDNPRQLTPQDPSVPIGPHTLPLHELEDNRVELEITVEDHGNLGGVATPLSADHGNPRG
ncbi:hypothetical protein JKP88DRAFT_249188 [Tribonema minus]|uniref:Uncharacterized protein n=1 Tax=Tribonema minus TaxID=303371 RepID=A0A835YUU3_9STRA|nr:hypothetical protein JKP88DRAFT_249188 [Tribonema minus]